MDDVKTSDDGASLAYINNIVLRKDGSIDIAGNTLFNVSNQVNPHSVVTKDYANNIKEGGGWVRKQQDGTYAIKRDLDMNNNERAMMALYRSTG